MSDVFISYATADREHAKRLARVLENRGWTVWWDRTILPGSDWQTVIERALDASTCVVVLWSRNSVDSGWVRAEAEEARRRNILIPASLDDARIPLVFRQLQTASLVGWNGKGSHAGLALLVQGISAVLEKSRSAGSSAPIAWPKTPRQRPWRQSPGRLGWLRACRELQRGFLPEVCGGRW